MYCVELISLPHYLEASWPCEHTQYPVEGFTSLLEILLSKSRERSTTHVHTGGCASVEREVSLQPPEDWKVVCKYGFPQPELHLRPFFLWVVTFSSAG